MALRQSDEVPSAVRAAPIPLPPPGSTGNAPAPVGSADAARGARELRASVTSTDLAATRALNQRDLARVFTPALVRSELDVVANAVTPAADGVLVIGGGVCSVTYSSVVQGSDGSVRLTADVVAYADQLDLTRHPAVVYAPANHLPVTATVVLQDGAWRVSAYDIADTGSAP